MKKTLLCLAALATGSALSAQITIMHTDIAPYYTRVLQNNDTTPTVNEGNAGANQTYNLSALNDQSTDTILFSNPAFTPNGSNFPGSNEVGIYNSGVAYIYFNLNAASFQITGQSIDPFGSGLIDIAFSDYEKVLDFPCTYNTGFVDTAKGEGWTYLGYDPGIGFQIDSVHVRTTILKTSYADGWGNVTTPYGTFNVLRVNTLRRQLDTVDIQTMSVWLYDAFVQDDSSRIYTYWANGQGYPVAELTDYQDFGTITSATWLDGFPQYNVGVAEFGNGTSMNVFPNPSVETVTFVTNGANVALISILDINGRVVRTATVTADQTPGNVSDLSSGMYFYQATDENGTILEKGKLNVHH